MKSKHVFHFACFQQTCADRADQRRFFFRLRTTRLSNKDRFANGNASYDSIIKRRARHEILFPCCCNENLGNPVYRYPVWTRHESERDTISLSRLLLRRAENRNEAGRSGRINCLITCTYGCRSTSDGENGVSRLSLSRLYIGGGGGARERIRTRKLARTTKRDGGLTRRSNDGRRLHSDRTAAARKRRSGGGARMRGSGRPRACDDAARRRGTGSERARDRPERRDDEGERGHGVANRARRRNAPGGRRRRRGRRRDGRTTDGVGKIVFSENEKHAVSIVRRDAFSTIITGRTEIDVEM